MGFRKGGRRHARLNGEVAVEQIRGREQPFAPVQAQDRRHEVTHFRSQL